MQKFKINKIKFNFFEKIHNFIFLSIIVACVSRTWNYFYFYLVRTVHNGEKNLNKKKRIGSRSIRLNSSKSSEEKKF